MKLGASTIRNRNNAAGGISEPPKRYVMLSQQVPVTQETNNTPTVVETEPDVSANGSQTNLHEAVQTDDAAV